MSQRTDSRYCPHCEKRVLALGDTPNHLLHLIITLCTCLLWVPVWIALTIIGSSYRCSKCGTKV